MSEAAAIDCVISVYQRLGKKIDKKFHDELVRDHRMTNIHVYDAKKHEWVSEPVKKAKYSDPIAAMKMENDYRLEEAKRAAEGGGQAPVIGQHGGEMDMDAVEEETKPVPKKRGRPRKTPKKASPKSRSKTVMLATNLSC
jgi:hypothetical protein